MARIIDNDFFKFYGPEKREYSDIYHHYSAIDDCIWLFKMEKAPKLRKILVFGSATGEVLNDFYQAFGLIPYGCEINKWAYDNTPTKFRKRVKPIDMVKYVREAIKEDMVFDIGFSNSFQYLEEDKVLPFFKNMAKVCRYVHFHSSFVGDSAKDPYRKTFKTYEWWNEKFVSAGFEERRDVWGNKSYLWKSTKIKPLRLVKS